MGLTNWEKSPDGKIVKSDVVIAKNYLTEDELESLGRIVNAYLDIAEDMAKRKILHFFLSALSVISVRDFSYKLLCFCEG